MKKLTSFNKMTTGEGIRVSFTYSEIDNTGFVAKKNVKGSFVALDAELLEHIQAIEQFINNKHLKE